MRFIPVLCASLPAVASFALRPPGYGYQHVTATTTATGCRTGIQPDYYNNRQQTRLVAHGHFATPRSLHSSSRGRRGSVTRRAAESEGGGGGGPSNMDDSDDPEDAEIFASLRKRLEELEKTAPSEKKQQEVQAAIRMTDTPLAGEFTVAKAGDSSSPKEKERSLAWLTIQSVGVISIALSFGTAALYYLAGEYFVHLGPREFPGASLRDGAAARSGLERTVDGDGAGSGSGSGGIGTTAPEKSRRIIGEVTTRDAFDFEGFPDVSRGR